MTTFNDRRTPTSKPPVGDTMPSVKPITPPKTGQITPMNPKSSANPGKLPGYTTLPKTTPMNPGGMNKQPGYTTLPGKVGPKPGTMKTQPGYTPLKNGM